MNLHRAHVSLPIAAVAVAVAAAWAGPARALDILTQDLVVDVSGASLHVEIDAVIDGGGELPIYAFAAPATATLDGAALSLVDDDGEYAGLVQWLTIPDGGQQTVHIVIDGAPSCSSQISPGLDSCTFTPSERVLLPGEPGSSWYLMSLLAADAFTGSVAVRAPADHFVAAGQGAALDVADEGAALLHSFEVTVPTEIMLVVSRAVDVVTAERVIAGVPNEAGRAAMQRVADAAAKVLPRYEAMFGALAVDEVHFLPVSGRFPFGGMGLLGNIMLAEFITLPEFDYMLEQGAAHELAHSWWGGMTSATDPNEGGFLQEAFAEYSAWRALGQDDASVRDAGVRMNAVWYLTQIGDGDLAILDAAGDPNAYVLVTYHKGSGVLRALEERVGADAFTAALAALVARGPQALSVAALQEEVERASGIDVEADLDQWLRRPGHPRLAVAVKDGAVHVDAEGFTVDVPLHLVRADGAVEEHVLGSGDSLALEALEVNQQNGVVLVEVDPRWTLVRTVEPALAGDVSCDGRVDAVDLMEIAFRSGGRIPDERRQDGSYDPLYDLDADGAVDDADVDVALAYALGNTP